MASTAAAARAGRRGIGGAASSVLRSCSGRLPAARVRTAMSRATSLTNRCMFDVEALVSLGCGLGATDRLNRSTWIELHALGRLLSIERKARRGGEDSRYECSCSCLPPILLLTPRLYTTTGWHDPRCPPSSPSGSALHHPEQSPRPRHRRLAPVRALGHTQTLPNTRLFP